MEYHHEVLDRASGRLETKSIGEWITITELGQRHAAGPKKVRVILHHMGILAHEGRRYRLPRHQVMAGLGIRHDKPKSGQPFDVISPQGQALIDAMWTETLKDYEAECGHDAEVSVIRATLSTFNSTRTAPMDTRQEVYWTLDHFPDTQHQTIAKALEVSPSIVSRYVKERSTRKRLLRERQAIPLVYVDRVVGDAVSASNLSATAPIEACELSDEACGLPSGKREQR